MVTYNTEELNAVIADITKNNITAEAWTWLNADSNTSSNLALNTAFAIIPRKTGKAVIRVAHEQEELLKSIRPGFAIDNWTADRLSRVWLLMRYKDVDEGHYFKAIENLFSAAEMNEQVALYTALPVLQYPKLWVKRCAEGIRSNIGTVLEAIMYNNPYPAENLEEAAWNQMVLKAFFTEKQVNKLFGLDNRANQELARILIDYAKERQAANRKVEDMLWYIVGKFVNDEQLDGMKQGKF
ncbi:EboA domain-containing protein [Mucilaginibacter sp.]|uniref:EboA domain-containing protein n=1 Tax=Mucilaginibacter sp. TaxID=1882438 RepID=UPI0025D3AEBD|nr:EboA domain-containing protein [Mucilaginibacter sp.]